MKVANIFAAVAAALFGAIGLIGGIVDKDATAVGLGIGLLVSAVVFGTFSSALASLEAIRDNLKKAGT